MLRSFAKLKQFLKRFFSTFSLFVEYCPEKSFSHSREPFGMAQGGNFSGIYMKVQLKSLKWDGEFECEE
ncbi:hypothetical protein YC2023_078442 [Brassica napus]